MKHVEAIEISIATQRHHYKRAFLIENSFYSSVLLIFKEKSKDLYIKTCPKALLRRPNGRFFILKYLMKNLMIVTVYAYIAQRRCFGEQKEYGTAAVN